MAEVTIELHKENIITQLQRGLFGFELNVRGSEMFLSNRVIYGNPPARNVTETHIRMCGRMCVGDSEFRTQARARRRHPTAL